MRGQLGPVLDHIRETNQRLITKAGRSFASDVAGVLDDPNNWGLRAAELAALLRERASVSTSRAELIARDQSAKTAGSINQFRQTNAGVRSYTWSGSLDERERETHLANEGQEFDWSSPPAETGHPTEDVNCRCIAIPVISDLEADPDLPGDLPPDLPLVGPSGPGEPPPPEAPEVAAAAEEPRRPIEEGVHVDKVVVRRGVDPEIAQYVLSSQPPEVLDALAARKLGSIELLKAKPSSVNPPGVWERYPDGRTTIRITTLTKDLESQRRSPEWTVSTRMAIKAADRVGGSVAQQERAARLARIQATTTHEIGHQIHGPPGKRGIPDPVTGQVDQKILATFHAAMADGSAVRVSTYATSNHSEFFAESFAAYFHAPELLSEKARDMVETVLKLRKGTP